MIIDALTVCIDFADYLAETLPLNKRLFTSMLVVTSPSDFATQRVCEENCVPWIATRRHLDEGKFNKGKVINDGLRAKKWTGWICHIDADTVVPPEFYRNLPKLCKDQLAIYGCHRYMVESVEDWNRYRKNGVVKHLRELRRTPQTLPVGYFQLWHSSQGYLYPEDIPLARSSDWRFSKLFPRHVNLDEYVIHLSADEWQRGRDDEGRKTVLWSA